MITIARIVLVGFGNIGQGLLPLLKQHFSAEVIIFEKTVSLDREIIARKYSAKLIEKRIDEQNYVICLGPLLNAQTVLLNFAVSVSSIDLIHLAQTHNASYLDSCIEPWEYGRSEQGFLESNYDLREAIQKIRSDCVGKSTAVIAHGANPGFISILMKKALREMALVNGLNCEPTSQKEWAKLARNLDIRVIQISERDTQVGSKQRKTDEFVCTWSVDGFITECLQAAEVGWGTHEAEQLPSGATLNCSKTQRVLELPTAGKDTLVRSWSPNNLDFNGYLLTHNESLSISEYLTVREGDDVIVYQPTVFYAYHPCDDTISSLGLLINSDEEKISAKRVLKEEITSGIDELGIFLISGTYDAFWLGSNLSIGKTRKMALHNNATSLQVVASVIAALKWIELNPRQGIIESEELDWEFIYTIALDYWSPIVAMSVNWSPDKRNNKLTFQEFLVNSR